MSIDALKEWSDSVKFGGPEPLTWVVLVDRDDWMAAKSGDLNARLRVGRSLQDVLLYDHAICGGPNHIAITLAELLCVPGIIASIRLHDYIHPL